METKNRFTYRGTLHEIGKVQTFSSGFKKCEIVCKTKSGDYTDYAVFAAKKELADKVQLLKAGDEIAVDFILDGHEWDGPKGKKWFGGATALKVETVSGVNATAPTQQPTAPTQMTIDEAVADDIPF